MCTKDRADKGEPSFSPLLICFNSLNKMRLKKKNNSLTHIIPDGGQCSGSSLPFLLLLFDVFPDFCQLRVCHVLLSQHISPKLSYFCFEIFSYRDDLIIRISFSHSYVFTIFSCSMEALFLSFICYSFFCPFSPIILLYCFVILALFSFISMV